jgi:uncharacterized protein with FMN-binding domain
MQRPKSDHKLILVGNCHPTLLGIAIALLLALPTPVAAEDVIEFLSGANVAGTVTKIDKDQKLVTFETTIGGRKYDRVYPYSKIHAVTYQGKRFVINAKSDTPTTPKPRPEPTGNNDEDEPTRPVTPTRAADIQPIIATAGKTPPDWFEATALDYPQSLDLAWPEKPPGGWNSQANVGQYIWDIINPNPGRWQSGVKFVHHLLSLHKDDPGKRIKAMKTLGNMYFIYFQDYARAAFWWQQAGVIESGSGNDRVSLAECYFRLGNRKLAETLLIDPEKLRPGKQNIAINMIKLWGDMGEPIKAVKLADMYARVGGQTHMAYLHAADACRTAGRLEDAMRLYQQIIDTPSPMKNPAGADKIKARARTNLEAIKLFELSDVSRVADGSYRAASQGYEGPVEVEVAVAAGKIESVKVTQHREKQFYSALTDVPNQIIAKQGVKGVDATSRATITGEAIINASAKALASGAK